jgi:hypothetical protein
MISKTVNTGHTSTSPKEGHQQVGVMPVTSLLAFTNLIIDSLYQHRWR